LGFANSLSKQVIAIHASDAKIPQAAAALPPELASRRRLRPAGSLASHLGCALGSGFALCRKLWA